MKDWFWNNLLWVIIAVVLLFLVVIIPFGLKQEEKYLNKCEQAGGKVLSTRGRDYCVRPDIFVEPAK